MEKTERFWAPEDPEKSFTERRGWVKLFKLFVFCVGLLAIGVFIWFRIG